jgi:hypothetical protein
VGIFYFSDASFAKKQNEEDIWQHCIRNMKEAKVNSLREEREREREVNSLRL